CATRSASYAARVRSMNAGSSSSRSGRSRRATRERTLRRGAGDEPCGLRLLAGRGVRVERALRGGAVDPADERAMLRGDRVGVAGLDGGLEALGQRLDRRAVADVLVPLASGDPDALLLLLDVRHRSSVCIARKGPLRAGVTMVATGEPGRPGVPERHSERPGSNR